ncbi:MULTISPECIES: NUDIX domain-containing protein [unclassified Brachybacterium]|uniref:NUDIX domain-containing protein n=1 Tax=unclassified Brachybacterium TaxID=2623841 RepID=UPI000C7FF2CB|nr:MULTISPECIES: NUDIX domain-containing protein [unclassified Brachybacterium]PMC74877.1 ADP-ribose pyrophosphatase [Brachybacterium sp. UMB0905]
MSQPRVGVKALIIDDGKVLLNHYVDDRGGEAYALPGGGQQHRESQPEALVRECEEEIGALVEVHQVALIYEVMMERRMVGGAPIPPFHQVNTVYWCGLAEGEEPGLGPSPDRGQAGTAWIALDELDAHPIHPVQLGAWLQSDPSSRPLSLGVTGV